MKEFISFLFCAPLLLTVVSCQSSRPSGSTEAEIVYKEAQEMVEDGSYMLASEKLNLLRSKFPYSYYATFAELLQADIYFLQESFIEAASAYLLFKDYHRRHPKLPYVIWRAGESFFKQVPSSFDRDLTACREAISQFRELIRSFPESEHAGEASERIEKCEGLFKKRQRYIADFYFRTEKYRAARFRYKDIFKRYLASPHQDLLGHALEKILLSSYHLKEYEVCLADYSQRGLITLEDGQQRKIERVKSRCQKRLDEK